MSKVFINAGHAPNGYPDPGACGNGLRESDVTAAVGALVEKYLNDAGIETKLLQSDSLGEIAASSNAWGADLFVSIHCNSAANENAKGTETFAYNGSPTGHLLAGCIQTQLINTLGTADRGVKEAGYYVIRETDCTGVLVELAFISNAEDAAILRDRQDDIARAIARGVTDYWQAKEDNASEDGAYHSKYFSEGEITCHCCGQGMDKISPRLLELLDQLRENIGGPLEVSCMYRCPTHNAEVGGVPNSQHVEGTAADLQQPSYLSRGQFLWYIQQLPFDAIGSYSWGFHVDVREGGIGAGIEF